MIQPTLKTLRLLLPALIPSWRFFDVIAPSPRIEFTVLDNLKTSPETWQEFRPRPSRVPMRRMLMRLFWNARWNESLFLVSCAERFMENGAEHSSREILKRIKAELERNGVPAPCLQFRLVCVSRQGTELQRVIAFVSPIYPYADAAS